MNAREFMARLDAEAASGQCRGFQMTHNSRQWTAHHRGPDLNYTCGHGKTCEAAIEDLAEKLYGLDVFDQEIEDLI